MAKKVRYNGGRDSYYPCTDPACLERDVVYKVVEVRDLGWQTNYSLEGVIGEFNSVWFSNVESQNQMYVGVSHERPFIGDTYFLKKVVFKNGAPVLISAATGPVLGVEYLGNNVYYVVAKDATFIVNVG